MTSRMTTYASAALLALVASVMPDRAVQAAIFMVINTDDSGAGSLRQAILDANADAVKDTIEFNIPDPGPHTIQPLTALPVLTQPVIIDGYSQPDASANTQLIDQPSDAVFQIILDGTSAGLSAIGLNIMGGDSTVKGLMIQNFDFNGIVFQIGGNNAIIGNYISGNVNGITDFGNSADNVIGGTNPSDRNVIAGNTGSGIQFSSPGNWIQGNFIGLDGAGVPFPNDLEGVYIRLDSDNNTIGGTEPGARNVISGNLRHGVRIESSLNQVQGNYIGTDITGTKDRGNGDNGGYGVVLINATSNLLDGNVISGNLTQVGILNPVSMLNRVINNFIGTDATGINPLDEATGTGGTGVFIVESPNNTIGAAPDQGNVIAYNVLGVVVDGANATGNSIRANSIHSNTFFMTDVAGIRLLDGGNTGLPAPTIDFAGSAEGSACAGCVIDVFSDFGEQGEIYEGSTVAFRSKGKWKWAFEGPVTGPNITATATDAGGNTSKFSTPRAIDTSTCTDTWPVTTVTTIAKGQSASANAMVSHEITGHIVGGAGAYGPTAASIELCFGTEVGVEITDLSGGATIITGACGPSVSCTIPAANFTANMKYTAVSTDGSDTDRVTLKPIP